MAISKRRPAAATPDPKQAAVDAAVASAKAAVADKAAGSHPPSPPPVGHNAPPKDDTLQEHRDRYAELRQAGEAWLKTGITDQETADLAEAWRKQVGSATRKADAARKAEKKPHDEAGAAVQKKWLPVIEAFERLDTPIRQKLTDFAVVQRERIRKEQEAAREAAEAARRDAERAAEQAMSSGTFSAHDHAAELARQAEDAEAVAKAAEAKKAQIGAGQVVDGRKRAAGLRDFETITVTDPVAALAALYLAAKAEPGVWLNGECLDGIREAIKTLFRAVRKANPEAAAKCPGISITTEERIV